MRSSNPVFSSLTQSGQRGGQAPGYQNDPYGQGYRGQQAAQQAAMQGYYQDPSFNQASAQGAERPMTVDDVIAKTGITLGVIIVGAIITYAIGVANPGLAMMLAGIGAIGGLITVLISAFGKKYGSAPITLTYAAFEGLFVGGISFMFTNMVVADTNAAVMIGQAVIGTVGVFIGMLYVYKTGAVKVTPKFQRIMTGALIGVVVLAIGNMLLYMFTGNNPLTDGGPLAIIFSLVCIGLAAFSFLNDFNMADQLVRQGAPAKMAWGVALGLAVTLVWLYTEILRLLSYFRN
ncbi:MULTISPECIES: Bax inhibitor-1/YccA family protein [Corynebacterium]|uniref:Bax inhibitor-1/YccA family protein n=1 Tax=Corynebacterium TaxID=1716 RepID=UPI00124DD385|nr:MULTISPECIES: Bax inhibitor-1/YccA family protein [Corynebacterium]MBV7281239.1 Bax inhibitor-1/YccA family protein [Corynebacterium sp. TAE3-ERU30]MBV7301809.1 Bax inhibitor-1/YccA family protein [Corynebacterium sp. TAE3-ERU2]